MAMLACLWELLERLHLTLEVATVDHGLRSEAAAEMALVAERAAALGLPWHALRVDVAAARRGQGAGGVQEVARRLRLAALEGCAARRGLGSIALGHNADDQAETVLFRILRGTGLKGLAGIPYRRGPFMRPLLDTTRATILSYLARRSLPFAADPSNRDRRYARVRLREDILPQLRRENPRVADALRSLAAAAAASSTGGADMLLDESSTAGELHLPARLRQRIEAAMADGRGTRRFDAAGGAKVTVAYGRARIEPRSPPAPAAVPLIIDGAGDYPWGAGDQVILVREIGSDPGRDGDRPADPTVDPTAGGVALAWAWFDGDRLIWPLRARSRRPGDRLRVRGGRGSRKLSDLLIDAKVPAPARNGLPIVTSADGELLFVPGLRPSGTGQPNGATRRKVGLALANLPDHDQDDDQLRARRPIGPAVDPSIKGSNTHKQRADPQDGSTRGR